MLKVVVDNETLFEVIESELQRGKDVSFKVKGTSMWPFYLDNKTTVTVSYPKTLKKRDVVLFHYQNQVLLHRILKIKGSTYTMRGDATFRKEVVQKDAIFGMVVKHQTQKMVMEQNKRYRLSVFLWVKNPFRTLLIRLRSK